MAEETQLDNCGVTGDMNALEAVARSWLATLPAGKSVNPSDVEAWLQSNNSSSIPDHIKSMPPSDVYQLIKSFSTPPSNEGKDPFYFRFQRSEQWMPVYNWLESLNTDEVVSKIQVQDWLTANATIMKDMVEKHPGCHLVHYIRKCHKKILKKRGKEEGLHTRVRKRSSKAHKTKEKKSLAMPPSSSATKLPKDGPTYMVKRNEAFQKYQILAELEKQLGAMFRNQETANVVTGP